MSLNSLILKPSTLSPRIFNVLNYSNSSLTMSVSIPSTNVTPSGHYQGKIVLSGWVCTEVEGGLKIQYLNWTEWKGMCPINIGKNIGQRGIISAVIAIEEAMRGPGIERSPSFLEKGVKRMSLAFARPFESLGRKKKRSDDVR